MNIPRCSNHNIEMIVKTAYRGKNASKKFWGCPTLRQTDKYVMLNTHITAEQDN